jgi:PAS domain S-box-containing protein
LDKREALSFRFSGAALLTAVGLAAGALAVLLVLAAARAEPLAGAVAAVGLLALLAAAGLYFAGMLPAGSAPLRRANRRYSNLVGSAPWGMHMYELRGRDLVLIDANAAADRILGVPMRPLIGKTIEQAFPPLEQTEIPARYRRAAQPGEAWNAEEVAYEGGQIRGAYEVHAFQTAPGEMAATFLDITERKRAAAELQRQRDLDDLLIDSIPGPFFLTDAALRLRRWNRLFEASSGYGAEQLRALRFSELAADADRSRLERLCRQVLGEGSPASCECHLRSRQGASTPYHLVLVRLLEDGQPRLLGVGIDLTELRRVERERDRLFDYSLDMLCIAGFDGFFKQLNHAWTALGWTHEQLLAQPWGTLVHPDDRQPTERALSVLRDGRKVRSFENRYRCADGSYRWLSWSSFPLAEEGLIFAVVRDVTEAKERQLELSRYRDRLEELVREKTGELEQTQRELLLKERQALLGRLTAAVSHELRNPLAVVRASVFAVSRKVGGQDPSLDRALARAERHILRCDEIVDQLLSFAQAPLLHPEPTEADRWLEAQLRELELPEWLEVSSQFESGVWLSLDRAAMHRVLVILVTNAVQAMEGLPPGDARRLQLQARRREGWLELRLCDSGPGIPQELREQAFEPPVSGRKFGVGLGLTIARLVVEQHGGAIGLSSVPGEGTVVTVTLPLRQERADERPAHPGG